MTPQTTASQSVNGSSDEARRTRTLAELAAEQGVSVPQRFDALYGAGADLWDNDAEFEEFQAFLRESRRTGS